MWGAGISGRLHKSFRILGLDSREYERIGDKLSHFNENESYLCNIVVIIYVT